MDFTQQISNIASFIIVGLISSVLNWPLQSFLLFRFSHENVEEYKKLFDLHGSAAFIGILERLIYIFAVMTSQFAVIGGWLTMKAFAKWLEKDDVRSKSVEVYNHYIIGNGMSLLVGLSMGELGRVLFRAFKAIHGS